MMRKLLLIYLILSISLFSRCSQSKGADENTYVTTFDRSTKTIHIVVALCDNRNQGIVPVPGEMGNGQDPQNNLYWGTAYGVKTYFTKSDQWQLVRKTNVKTPILERLVFKHTRKNYYIVADAYNGKYIREATQTFLKSSAGLTKDTLHLDSKVIGIDGNSQLAAYIGHNGLMDFFMKEMFTNEDGKERDVIILACYSKKYFAKHIEAAQGNPLVWTTGLMSPEAYTIHDALTGYINEESNEAIRLRAAKAYARYQKCSVAAAKKLLVTGE